MNEQSNFDDDPDTDPSDDVPLRPVRPADTKAIIMHDTGEEWFGYYVNNCERAAVLEQYLELETDRDDPRRNRIGMANERLQELR
jgi:hypothetical protein